MSRGKAIAGVGLCSLVLLGVLAALAQTAEKPPTELYVRTSPPGAKVFIDGKEVGTSPSLIEVEPGEHTIVVTLEAHQPKTSKVTIPDGRIRRVILELQKGPEARDQQPEARGAAWGEPVEGVQCRIRAEKPTWPQGTVPKLLADLRNQGQRDLRIAIESESWEIEIDGTWHRPNTAFSGDRHYLPLGPAAVQQNLEVWIPEVDNLAEKLRALQPGKHTLRVARLLNDSRRPGEEILRLVSNPIEIEITPAEVRPKAPDQEPAWGKQVENLQCRIRAEKAAWTAGTVPRLFGDLRSYDMWQPDLSTASENWEIEIDGKWHKNQRAKLQGSHGGKVIFLSWPATEHCVQEAVYQLAIDAEQSAARSLRALAPGKHVLRAGYRFGALPPDTAKTMSIILEHGMGPHWFSRSGEAVHVVSNPIEIEIVATEAATGTGVSGEAKLSPRKLMHAVLSKDVGVLAVAFSPSGKTLATVDEAGQVRLHNARAGTETLSFNLLTAEERKAIFRDASRQRILTGGIAFSPGGMILAVGGGPVVKLYDVASGRPDLTLKDEQLVNAPGGRGDQSQPAAVPYAHGRVFCVAFSPDGTLLATSGDVIRDVGEDTGATPGHLKLWDAKTGELKRDLGDYYPSVRSVAFSPDGKTLAGVGTHPPEGTSSVRLWDPQTGTVKSVLPIARGGIPWSVAFSPDGKLVAACALVSEGDRGGRQGERGCKLLVWNAQTGAPLCNRPLPGLASLSFSADSKTLAAGADGRGVTLWDAETLEPKGEIQPSTDSLRDVQVAFAPTGNLLAVAAKDAKQGGFVTVWDIGRHEGHAAPEAGDTETVYVCRAHPQVAEVHPGTCPICRQPLEGKRQAVFAKNLKQIGLAMIAYSETHGTFPPAYSTAKGGKPLLSWRVQILPLLGQEALYERFHLDEPWDSEHNKRLISSMPEVFRAPGSNAGPGKTNYLTVRGENTAFPGQEAVGLSGILDGLSNTIMVVEASDARAVLWTKPDDFPYDKKDPIAGLVGLRRGGFSAVLCDCSLCFIRAAAGTQAVIEALFTRNDGLAIEAGEPVVLDVNGGGW